MVVLRPFGYRPLWYTVAIFIAALALWACRPVTPVPPAIGTRSVTPLAPPPLVRGSINGTTLPAPLSPLTTTAPASSPVSAAQAVTLPVTAATAVLTPDADALTLLPTPTPNRAADLLPTPTSSLQLLPTQVATTPGDSVLLPTPTPAQAATAQPLAQAPAGTDNALPSAYVAQGSYASTTVYTDATTSQQQGSFTIVQAVAANVYGFNQQITLTTRRAEGLTDVIQVYLVDDYILVDYGEGDEATEGANWVIVRRDQGSGLVRAIQPITDLALLFPRVVEQAELIGAEQVAGQDTLHYRIQGQSALGARLVQPLLAITGDFRALQLDAWLAIPGGYVLRYSFQVDLEDARVLDAQRNEVRADQAVTWTYQLSPVEQPLNVIWPSQAPRPEAWPIPGFAPGAFPIPPETDFVSALDNVIELRTATPTGAVADFYRSELSRLGWTVAGQNALLRCSKAGDSFELLIVDDQIGAGTTITVIPTANPGE